MWFMADSRTSTSSTPSLKEILGITNQFAITDNPQQIKGSRFLVDHKKHSTDFSRIAREKDATRGSYGVHLQPVIRQSSGCGVLLCNLAFGRRKTVRVNPEVRSLLDS
jgi:hypothetical protein